MRTRPASSGRAALLIAAGLAAAGPSPASAPATPPAAPQVMFQEVAEASGVRFRHDSGATAQKNMIEDMGSGVCFIDYDRDGDADLYFVQSGPVPGAPGP